ncbi:MAG: ImmA/IrrE family metallo-endopeptidase [Cyanobacteria bacterium J06621_8]
MADIEMATLFKRLNQIGFSKNFIQQKVLPDWWSADCESTPGAVIEAAAYISRRLNLDLSSLLDIDTELRFRNSCQPKFKKQQNTNTEDLKVSHCLASRIAELTAYACKTKYQPIDNYSVAKIRNMLLSSRQHIDLESVLQFCWNHGIPVVHFNEFPKGVKKFHGMLAFFDKRPVIIVSLKDKSLTRLLFVVLHELGHIYRKHLNNTFLIDEKIEFEDSDEEEAEANELAVEVMFGQLDRRNLLFPQLPSGEDIAQFALNISKNQPNVDPGSIVMNDAWHRANLAEATKNDKKNIWAQARKALKIIEGEVNALVKINSFLKENLDWEKLNEDNQEYLASMTGLKIEDVVGG